MDSDEPIIILNMLDLPRRLAIWNFIVDSRHIITKNITWEVYNGRQAQFREDSWDFYLALQSSRDLDQIREETTRVWGMKVLDYSWVDSENGK